LPMIAAEWSQAHFLFTATIIFSVRHYE
jgi:hypothetical protein